MLKLVGDTIEIHGRPVATVTVSTGTLRALLAELLEAANRNVDAELSGAFDDGYTKGWTAGEESGRQSGYDAGRRDAARERAT